MVEAEAARGTRDEDQNSGVVFGESASKRRDSPVEALSGILGTTRPPIRYVVGVTNPDARAAAIRARMKAAFPEDPNSPANTRVDTPFAVETNAYLRGAFLAGLRKYCDKEKIDIVRLVEDRGWLTSSFDIVLKASPNHIDTLRRWLKSTSVRILPR